MWSPEEEGEAGTHKGCPYTGRTNSHFGGSAMRIGRAIRPLALFSICLIIFLTACSRKETVSKPGPAEKAKVTVNWDKVVTVSKTTPTLQVVVNPPLRRGTKIHDRVFKLCTSLVLTTFATCPGYLSPSWSSRSSSRRRTARLPGTFPLSTP